VSQFLIVLLLKETDLIYEGIATIVASFVCEKQSAKKLTWFTKGLRRLRYAVILPGILRKETDLIYEGIATLVLNMKQCSVGGKETDLIYEGIATHS